MRTALLLTIVFCFILLTSAGAAPAPPAPPAPLRTHQEIETHSRSSAQERTLRDIERMQQKAANKKRQEDLKRDTDKLLQLATELKQYVDKTNQDILSIEVIRKADEIEKLAKSVQKKMKNE